MAGLRVLDGQGRAAGNAVNTSMSTNFVDVDGRSLCYSEFGDSQGRPVFYFHGFPGSRLGAQIGDRASKRYGIRLIAIDRPGYGQSCYQYGRSITDWPADVEAVADHLGLDTFSVLGASGGTPYVLACAAMIPHRIDKVGLICPLAPAEAVSERAEMGRIDRLGIYLATRREFYTKIASYFMRMTIPRRAKDNQVVFQSTMEAYRQGIHGPAHDFWLISNTWGIDLNTIEHHVQIWTGEMDTVTPVSMTRYFANTLSSAEATYFESEDHYSVIFNRVRTILQNL